MSTTQARAAAVTARISPSVLVAIIVTMLAWASAFVVIRGTAPSFGGGELALGRMIVALFLLAIPLIGRKWVAPTRREWLLLTGYGVGWFAVYNVALNTAETTLDAGTASLIVNVSPVFIAVGAGLVLREGVHRWIVVGALVALVGIVLIGIGTSGARAADGGTAFGDGVGVIWCLVAALTYSFGVLCQKPALRRLPAAQVTWLGCVIGLIACLPFTGSLIEEVAVASAPSLLGLLYLGAIPTALAFSTWTYALSRMPAGQLAVSTYIVPPLAIALGFLAFGEIPAPLAIVGGAVCLIGVAVSRRQPPA